MENKTQKLQKIDYPVVINSCFPLRSKLIIPIYKLEESENFDCSTGCQDSCTLRVIRIKSPGPQLFKITDKIYDRITIPESFCD